MVVISDVGLGVLILPIGWDVLVLLVDWSLIDVFWYCPLIGYCLVSVNIPGLDVNTVPGLLMAILKRPAFVSHTYVSFQ